MKDKKVLINPKEKYRRGKKIKGKENTKKRQKEKQRRRIYIQNQLHQSKSIQILESFYQQVLCEKNFFIPHTSTKNIDEFLQKWKKEILLAQNYSESITEIIDSSDGKILLSKPNITAILSEKKHLKQITTDQKRIIINYQQLNAQSFEAVLEAVREMRNQDIKLHQISESLSKKKQDFELTLSRKTFEKGFQETEIDKWNYFKLREHQQQKKVGSYQPINSQEEMNYFMKKRKNKFRKASKFLLHTACQSCLSPHFEEQNPLINCPECHLRIHKLCLDLSKVKRCGRCIFNRIIKNNRAELFQCFICQRNSLVSQRVGSKLFAHTFCLLSEKLETLKNGSVLLSDKEPDMKNEKEQCCVCGNSSEFLHACWTCGKKMHMICAFLEGFRIKVINRNQKPQFTCCIDPQKRKMLSEKRKFILNFRDSKGKKKKKRKSE